MKQRFLFSLLWVFIFSLLFPTSLSATSYYFSIDGFTQPTEEVEEIEETDFDYQSDQLPSFEFQPDEQLFSDSQLEVYSDNYAQTYAAGDGLYVLIRDFIGYVPDYANQNINQYQYLYPASVIVTVVLVVLVAKVLFTIVDRLL